MTLHVRSDSEDLTGDDHLVERTDNGLREVDDTLDQPSQDPQDVPASLVDADGNAT